MNTRASAINTGLLSGANVSMTSHAANGIATGVVNMSGIITAQGVLNVGGTIVLDAGNGTLTTTGTLNAAGATGGGHIETSGQTANISGHITAGQGGQWKVDPEDLTIDSSAATTIDGAPTRARACWNRRPPARHPAPGTQTAGAGNIAVASALSWGSTATLTLDSDHSINIDAPITITGAGGLVLLTNDNGGSGGALNFALRSYRLHGQGRVHRRGRRCHTRRANDQFVTRIRWKTASRSWLTDIATTPAGNFALANSYNASGDNGGTPYSGPVIATTFAGNFEGLGNTISNLSVDSELSPVDQAVGLFRIVNGNISDLDLSGGSIIGNADVGALAAIDNGSVTNVHSSTAVTGFYQVGGLIGDSTGVVSNSSSSGTVTGQLVDSSSSGEPSAIGGLIGEVDSGSVTGSYATGNVTAPGSDYVGGLIGYTLGNNNVIVNYSYATGNVDGGFDPSTFTAGISVGGLIGDNEAQSSIPMPPVPFSALRMWAA